MEKLKKRRLGTIGVVAIIICIIGAMGVSYALPYLIELKEGAEIVKSYTTFGANGVTVQGDKLCMNGGMLMTGYDFDEHGNASLEFLNRQEWVRFVVDAVDRTYICGNRAGNSPEVVSVPQENSMTYKPGPQVLNWYVYNSGAAQKHTFLLPDLGMGGAYYVEDWNADWILLNQHLSEKVGPDTVILLNVHSGEIVRPRFPLDGATHAGVLVRDGFTFLFERDVYLYNMHNTQTTKLGSLEGGAQEFDGLGSVIAWGGSGRKAKIVIRDTEKNKEWVVDGQMPVLVGGKVIRATRTIEEPDEDGAIPMDIVASNWDGSDRRVLAHASRWTSFAYDKGVLYYKESVKNLQFPRGEVHSAVSGNYRDYGLIGETTYLMAKKVDLE